MNKREREAQRINVLGDSGISLLSRVLPDRESDQSYLGRTVKELHTGGGRTLCGNILRELLPNCHVDFANVENTPPELLIDLSAYADEENKGSYSLRIGRISSREKIPKNDAKTDPLNPQQTTRETSDSLTIDEKPSTTVIVDLGSTRNTGWRMKRHPESYWRERLEHQHRIFVDIPGQAPESYHYDDKFYSNDNGVSFWNFVSNDEITRRKSIVVCSVSALRRQGAIISKRISWERTVLDTLDELERFEPLKRLDRFGGLIIRFGVTGAIYRYTNHESGRRETDFIFDPLAKDGIFRDQERSGRIIGKNVLMIGSLLRSTDGTFLPNTHSSKQKHINEDVKATSGLELRAVRTGLKLSLIAIQRVFEKGFPEKYFLKDKDRTNNLVKDYTRPARKVLSPNSDGRQKQKWIREEKRIGHNHIKSKPDRDWQIFNDSLSLDSQAERVNVALAVAKYGVKHVLNKPHRSDDEIGRVLSSGNMHFGDGDEADNKILKGGRLPIIPKDEIDPPHAQPTRDLEPLYVPVMAFGKYLAIDRSEIESLRAVQNLMRHYVDGVKTNSPSTETPLSLSVFGPPGTGKSYVVKQIGELFRDEIETLEFNLAQFESISDLTRAVDKIRSVNLESKSRVPLVFFDEFDADSNRWLKYFLALMQDGKFTRPGGDSGSVGSAILVFAGGTSSQFSEFDKEISGTEDDLAQFRKSKGPDFVSRLRAHIDISSINLTNKGDRKPVIRRAITLRSLMEKLKYIDKSSADRGEAMVSDEVMFAFLTTDKFRHGIRSMQAILEMSARHYGRIDASSLPAQEQLQMHVNPRDFHARIQRHRMHRRAIDKREHAARAGAAEQ